MKPAPFEYVAARSVAEAVELLDEDSRVLAGGQSLVPLLNLRLARPRRLVDINPIRELGVIRRTDGVLRIGATVRQAALERSRLVAEGWPLLAQAVRFVGHSATRSRGTVGGSLAHADPKAELPVALAALDATFVTTRRRLSAEEFFTGPLTTVLEPHELLVGVEVPPQRGRGTFAEFARTHGDFADAAVAVVVGRGHAAVATLGPIRASRAERALIKHATAREAAELVAQGEGHQRALVVELTRRALIEAGRP